MKHKITFGFEELRVIPDVGLFIDFQRKTNKYYLFTHMSEPQIIKLTQNLEILDMT